MELLNLGDLCCRQLGVRRKRMYVRYMDQVTVGEMPLDPCSPVTMRQYRVLRARSILWETSSSGDSFPALRVMQDE